VVGAPSVAPRVRPPRTSGRLDVGAEVSDFVSLRDFRRTAIYDAFYRGYLDYWLDFGVPRAGGRTRVFIVSRRAWPDFDERDRLVERLVAPHLAARAADVETAAEAAGELATVEEDSDGETQRIVLCAANGQIEFASPVARALLRRYVGVENDRLAGRLESTDGSTDSSLATAVSGGSLQ
jgi:hypothetical protein